MKSLSNSFKTLLFILALVAASFTSCSKDYDATPAGEREFIVKSAFIIEAADAKTSTWHLKATKKYLGEEYKISTIVPKDVFNSHDRGDLVNGHVFVNYTDK